MLNKATTTESDGALGIRPSLSNLPLAIVGQTTAGTANQPTSLTSADQAQSLFGVGRGVEAACYAIDRLGLTVVMCKAATNVAANYGTVDDADKAGSSTITVDSDGSNKPNDDYELVVTFSTDDGTDGTVGAASPAISLAVSLDAGRSVLATKPLGTANTYTVPGTNVKLDFGAGTIKDGDVIRVAVRAEDSDATDVGNALTALQNTSLSYEVVAVLVDADNTITDACDTFLAAMHAAGKHKNLVTGFRVQGIYSTDVGGAAESDAAYTAAFNSEFSASADSSMYVAAGACKLASSVTRGRRARRSPAFPFAAMLASVSEEVDISDLDHPLPGCTIRDQNGNPDPGYYDETVSPGLDDVRAMTLRTWDGETGVYVNQPRLLSAVGSDFDFAPKRRVMNLARGTAVAWLRKFVVSKPLRTASGHVTEAELQSLEAAINAKLDAVIMKKPKASAVQVVLSRNDDVLEPPYPLTGKLRLVPLAYPKDVSLDAGWALSEPVTVTGVVTG